MKNNKSDLELIIERNKTQKEIYQPTSFWEKASKNIIEDIENWGIENFRKLRTPLSYFVPTYGIPGNSYTTDLKDKINYFIKNNGTNKQLLAMDEFLSGYLRALSDYRVFIASDDNSKKPLLKNFSESNYGNPIEQFEFDGNRYSCSSFNYILGICFLKKYLKDENEIKTVLEIGGGFGILGEILYSSGDIKYIDIEMYNTLHKCRTCYINE